MCWRRANKSAAKERATQFHPAGESGLQRAGRHALHFAQLRHLEPPLVEGLRRGAEETQPRTFLTENLEPVVYHEAPAFRQSLTQIGRAACRESGEIRVE